MSNKKHPDYLPPETVKALHKAVNAISDGTMKRVTIFLPGLKERVSITRVHYKRAKNDIRNGNLTIQIGRPNYAERQFLKDCKKAGCEPKKSGWFKYFI